MQQHHPSIIRGVEVVGRRRQITISVDWSMRGQPGDARQSHRVFVERMADAKRYQIVPLEPPGPDKIKIGMRSRPAPHIVAMDLRAAWLMLNAFVLSLRIFVLFQWSTMTVCALQ